MSSLLVQVPQALSFRCFEPWAKCPVRRYVAPARNSALQEPIHQFWIQRFILKSGFEKNFSIGLILKKKKKKTSSLPLNYLFDPFWWKSWGNSSAFGPFLWRNHPEERTPSPITQPEPWGSSGRVSPISTNKVLKIDRHEFFLKCLPSQGTSLNNYESNISVIQTASVEFSDRSWIPKLALTCRKSSEIVSKTHPFT